MLIGLDARTIYSPTRRGTGKNLIDLYHALADVRPDWRITAYHRGSDTPTPLLPAQTVTPRFVEMIGDRFDAWQQFRLPMAAWRDGVDVLHCPANTCPSWMTTPTAVTIHDLIPLDMPQQHDPATVQRFAQSVRTACRRAAWIICPSSYTRHRLVDEFDADPRRITVNPWAPDSSVRLLDDAACHLMRLKYGLFKRTVLHFGANPRTGLRKNTRRVIEAWALLKRAQRDDWELLIVGLDEAGRDELRRTVHRLNVANSVHLHGFADEADLPGLLSVADVLAYPSLSEGFGLPILDAWATDTAVLSSNTTSIPEVAQDAAHLVDPVDTCAIAKGLRKLLGDRQYREELIQRGRLQRQRFSWQATAERFAWAMEQAVSLSRPRRQAA